MSMSRLSNHLYVVVTAIVSLHAAPSTFHQARASHGSHDFTESRQFRKNLAASKYKDNPHWLTNYTWKPPEKFYGPRKRPAWEVDTVTEPEADREQQEQLEEWEKKMRDVTKRQREKWEAYGALEKPEPNDVQKVNSPTAQVSDVATITPPTEVTLKQTPSNREKPEEVSKKYETTSDIQNEWNKNLHNGRWGFSAAMPADDGSSSYRPSSSGEPKLVHQTNERTTLSAIISNGRWGMSVKDAPKEFSKELSRKSSMSEIPGEARKQDKVAKSKGNEEIHDGYDAEVKEVNTAAEPTPTRFPEVLPSGQWGMNSDLPPREFLREISRRGLASRPIFHTPNIDVHQPSRANHENNSPSRESMLSQIPGISNIVFLQPFPGVIDGPTLTNYVPMQPRILANVPNYNIVILPLVIARSEFPLRAEY